MSAESLENAYRALLDACCVAVRNGGFCFGSDFERLCLLEDARGVYDAIRELLSSGPLEEALPQAVDAAWRALDQALRLAETRAALGLEKEAGCQA